MAEDDDVEVEDFGVSEFDLDNALNPGQSRRRLTKHQQTYGIWADESDDEDQRPSFGRKKFNNAAVNFVSGGIKQSGAPNTEITSENPEDEDEEELLRTMAFKKFHSKNKLKKKAANVLPQEIAGLRGGFANKNDGDFGSWERHTKGIGQKLLLQMGYQPGKGLGKTLQGISAPVEAKKRPGKGAIGMYGSERTKASLKHFPQEPTDEENDKIFRDKLQQWKRKPGEEEKKQKKVNYVYKSVDDVKSDGTYRKLTGLYDNKKGSMCQDKIIDMTGPQQRVLSGYQSLHHQHMKPDTEVSDTSTALPQKDVFEMPALLYNIDMLIDMSEQEIIKNDRDIQHHKDVILSNGHQEENLDNLVESEQRQIKAIESVLKLIDDIDAESNESNENSLSRVEEVFRALQRSYYEEYKMFGLSDLAIPIVYPLIKKILQDWNPLKDNLMVINLFKTWKDLLEENMTINDFSGHKDGQLSDRYHRLVWEVWMPFVRQAVTNEWHARDCDSLIEMVENWMPVIPQWIINNVLDQLIFPRLQTEVENWNPLTDTMPIHSWLHPWLPLMGERLEPLYAPIRQKLGNALVCWHPSDQSAKLILQPWVPVFSKGTMHAFVLKNVLPKLVLVLQEFVINPHQQHLDPWHWVMTWEDFIPVTSLVNILDKHFFPRWIQVLCTWLNSSPDYEEVSKWYRGWKSMFSNSLISDPTIKGHFNKALEFLNRAISQPQQQNYPPANDMRQPPMMPRAPPHAMGRGIASAPLRSAASGGLNFKELLAIKAEENNLLFMPIPNRYYEGKQVYRFGKLMIYIDRTVVLYLNVDIWQPTSLNDLLSLAI